MLGAGTQANPYILETAEDIVNLKNYLGLTVRYFELGNDIDMSSINHIPIGETASLKRWRSHFDGKGFTIKNLTVNATAMYSGFFGMIEENAVIKNIRFDNAIITSSSSYVGVVAGAVIGSSTTKIPTIENICVINSLVKGTNNISGLVGASSATIRNCYSDTKVVVSNTGTTKTAYGITISDTAAYDTIENCVFNGEIDIENLKPTDTVNVAPITNDVRSNGMINNYYNSDNMSGYSFETSAIGVSTLDWNNSDSFILDTDYWSFAPQPYLTMFPLPKKINVGERNAISFIKSIGASAKTQSKKINKGERITTSYVGYLNAHTDVVRRSTLNANSFIKTIDSNATSEHRQVKSYTVQATSHIARIGSHATCKGRKKGVVYATSYSKSIGSTVRVTSYKERVQSEQLYAYAEEIYNQTQHSSNYYQSNAFYIENQSYTEEIE